MGAARADIVRLLIGEGLIWTSGGLAAGVIGSILLTRTISSLLFEVSPTDLLTFSAVAALVLAVAGIACYIPARSSARLDPSVALRQQT